MTDAKQTEVVVIGEAMIELSAAGDRSLTWTFAGDTLNCAAAMAAAGAGISVHYITGIGDDQISREFVEFCSDIGVDADGSVVVPGHDLGLYWISTHEGERSFRYWRNESAARQVLRSGIQLPHPNEIDAVVLSAITLAVAGTGAEQLIDDVRGLRHAGALVCFDANYRPALWPDVAHARDAVEHAAGIADVMIASADDVRSLWDESNDEFCGRMAAAGVGEILVTDGARPLVARIGNERLEVAPPAVDVVDTTGAGDAFFGTYLGHRLAGRTPAGAIDRAVDVAAVVVGTSGALTYLTE